MLSDSESPASGTLQRSSRSRGTAPRAVAAADAPAFVILFSDKECGNVVRLRAIVSTTALSIGVCGLNTQHTTHQEPEGGQRERAVHQVHLLTVPPTGAPMTEKPRAFIQEFSVVGLLVVARQTTHEHPPQVTTIAYKLSSVLSAVHALVLLAALLFYRAYYNPNNSTMSVSFPVRGKDEQHTHTCVPK